MGLTRRSIDRSWAPWLAVACSLVVLAGCGRLNARMALKNGNEDYKKKAYESAIKHYAEIPTEYPLRADAALNTGYSFMSLYKWGSKAERDRGYSESAVKAFDEFLHLRPAQAPPERYPVVEDIEQNIISLLIDSDRYQDAIDRLLAKHEKNPKDAAILGGLAAAYDKWGKPAVVLRYRQQQAAISEPGARAGAAAAIGAYCWNVSYRHGTQMTPIERNRWVDVGLEAADAALKINADHMDGLTYRNLLLRERAKMRVDPDEVGALVGEAQSILAQVNEMRKKLKEQEDAARAKAQEAAPTPGSGDHT